MFVSFLLSLCWATEKVQSSFVAWSENKGALGMRARKREKKKARTHPFLFCCLYLLVESYRKTV